MKLPIVAVVGRPNVGKSTIFNRLIGERVSIVEDKPGVTRDRIYGHSDWNGVNYIVIDTGGIDLESSSNILDRMRMQVDLAIDESDVVLFIVDSKDGITPMDLEIANILRKSNKKVVVGVNKIDNHSHTHELYQFYQLGFDDIFPISSVHGLGTGDLLDAVVLLFDDNEVEEYDSEITKIAVIGRPNVGKSSLVNAMLGKDRVIVSPEAGTTRDAIDTPFDRNGNSYVLIDTAGMRKRGKVYESVEKYSVLRSLKAIDRSDVCLILIDAHEGIIEQDKKIAGYAHEAGKACIFVVNKWDLVEKDTHTMNNFKKDILQQFKFMTYAPSIFVSAKNNRRVDKILPLVEEVSEQHAMRISTSTLNGVIMDAINIVPPSSHKGRKLKIQYLTQVSVKPPTFVLFVNDPELAHFSYIRYLENYFRETFGFVGTPININLKRKNKNN